MKKKFKNKELEELLIAVSHLGSYAMPGELTLAIVGTRKHLKTALESFTEACKQIGDSRCERDVNGFPITTFQKDSDGRDLEDQPKKLKFKDLATEQAALEELRKLGEQEIEIEIKEFEIVVLESLKEVTPIQMEAITSLIEIKRN